GTSLGKALKQAEKFLLAADDGDKMIVLLSDGESFDLFQGNDVKVAESLKANGIAVYTVHIGSGTAPTEVSLISSMTGGQTFATGDPEALEVIFKRIDEMAQAPLERLRPDPIDNFRPFVISALSLGSIYLVTLFGLRYTPW
ncbi:MAG: vWA domain-containing protein, partial [Verrucomicrobiota bacterium]